MRQHSGSLRFQTVALCAFAITEPVAVTSMPKGNQRARHPDLQVSRRAWSRRAAFVSRRALRALQRLQREPYAQKAEPQNSSSVHRNSGNLQTLQSSREYRHETRREDANRATPLGASHSQPAHEPPPASFDRNKTPMADGP